MAAEDVRTDMEVAAELGQLKDQFYRMEQAFSSFKNQAHQNYQHKSQQSQAQSQQQQQQAFNQLQQTIQQGMQALDQANQYIQSTQIK